MNIDGKWLEISILDSKELVTYKPMFLLLNYLSFKGLLLNLYCKTQYLNFFGKILLFKKNIVLSFFKNFIIY